MDNKVVIIGASGHGKVIADIIIKSGDKVVGFLDDDTTKKIWNIPTLGAVCDYAKYASDCKFIVAIGNNTIRKNIMETLECDWYNAIHPTATIGYGVEYGNGIVLMANAVVNSDAKICDGVIINTNASVDHDCQIGKCAHISVNSAIAGGCKIGSEVFVGAGATIKNNINISDKITIGAGATVVNDLYEAGTYIGTPAKKMV
ncbi:MAG: acetyltransferase [Bacillota bacterium]